MPRIALSSLKAGRIATARQYGLPVGGCDGITLIPVGAWIIADTALIRSMANWRARARDMFFARFPESAEGMRAYLEEVSLCREDVILFVIENDEHQPLGHIGLTGVNSQSAEIDSVMRNPDVVRPKGLMELTMRTLIEWATECLGVERLTLKVISGNSRAIRLYERVGFRQTSARRLRRRVEGDHTFHDEVDEAEANVEDLCIVMELVVGGDSDRGSG